MIRAIFFAISVVALLGCEEQSEASKEVTVSTSNKKQPTSVNSTVNKEDSEFTHSASEKVITLSAGDTLTSLLENYQFTARDSLMLERAVKPWTSLTKLQAGQAIAISVEQGQVQSIAFELAFATLLRATRDQSHWQVTEHQLASKKTIKHLSGTIETSFFVDAIKMGIPQDIINQSIVALSHLLDFQRELYPGDNIDFVYTQLELVDAPSIMKQQQKVLALEHIGVSSAKQNYRLFHFIDDTQSSAFYFPSGKLAQSFLMKTPLNGARLSSHFGQRHHPVLGYSRVHKGLDFGAPIGTPIMAAGSGKVVKAGWGGSFGNRIVLAHEQGYETLYAHLNGLAEGIKVGVTVKQGEVIGYLGNTGLSQARHLHYEVHKNGKAINPLQLKQPHNTQLAGHKLQRFLNKVAALKRGMADQTQLAKLIALTKEGSENYD